MTELKRAGNDDVVTVRTMCPMNCHPTLCGMLVQVQGDKILSVKGDPDNPDSAGFLCIRGQASKEIFNNPGRLLKPLIRDRRTDAFRQASWEEALEKIASGILAAPPEATAFWPGHGTFANNYGTRINSQLMARFANIHGSQFWNSTMVCWGLGAFGLALTGMLETNTKEDMGEHARLILLWGANLASQPNTARHLLAAKARGARIITIDVRQTEAAAKSDDVLILRPGSDTALALSMMQVICAEKLYDAAIVTEHSVGFEALARQVQDFTPDWASQLTGLTAAQIIDLARSYATSGPAMIVLGGSSLHKGDNGWEAGRAIACLPGLTGNVGKPGTGFGPRHGSAAHGRGLGNITALERRAAGTAMPNQMSGISEALQEGKIRNLLLMGSNMLSSFSDANAVARGLTQTRMIVSYDLFLNDTAHEFADVVLPATAWLEELGCKATHTHLYLMPKVLEPEGEARTVREVMRDLATRLDLADYFPWADDEAMVNAALDHPCTGPATVASLEAQGGIVAMNISHVANPTLKFDTPSGKIEFYSAKAESLGLPALPVMHEADTAPMQQAWPLALAQGRTLGHFHSFYNNGRALPTLARRETTPELWLSSADAATRHISQGNAIRLFNQRGTMNAIARVTDKIPAGSVWMRDGWPELNRLSEGRTVLPDAAADLFSFSAGQASYTTRVEVEIATTPAI